MVIKINMRILGIDPGFDRMGLGVVDASSGSSKWVHHSCVQTNAGDEIGERLKNIRDGLAAAIKKYQPQVIAVEKLFFQTNVKTAINVSMARGVILLAAADAGLPVVELTPNQVKQGIAGFGNADKKQVQMMVRALLKLKTIPKPDDAADALAIAMVGALYYHISVCQKNQPRKVRTRFRFRKKTFRRLS